MLAELDSQLLVTCHGAPAAGAGMRQALHRLAGDFASVALPDGTKYVREPATVENGGIYRAP